MNPEAKYSVWVGGTEANNYLLTKFEADSLAYEYKEKGYNDVSVDEYESLENFRSAVKQIFKDYWRREIEGRY